MPYAIFGILLFPLLGFLALALLRMPARLVSLVGPGSVLLSFLCAAYSFVWLQSNGGSVDAYDAYATRWVIAGTFHLKIGFLLDPLSSTMTLIITGVGFLILVYSVGYMAGEGGYRRFF